MVQPIKKGDSPHENQDIVPFHEIIWFFLLAIALLALFIYTLWDELHPAWKEYRVSQIYHQELSVTDRCITCHNVNKNQNSPSHDLHDIEKIGCTLCHDGQGRSTQIPSAHGEVEHWNKPLLRKNLVQANCSRCHNSQTVSSAVQLRNGMNLIDHYACFGCHNMSKKKDLGSIAIDLSFAVARSSPSFIYLWLKNPKQMLQNARMGNFELSDNEVIDIIAYLQTFQDTARLKEVTTLSDKSSDQLDELFDRGLKMFRMSRCMSCHAVNGTGGKIGPDLGKVGNKLSLSAIDAWIENPTTFFKHSQMPKYRLNHEDRLAISYYLSEEMRDQSISDLLFETQNNIRSLLSTAEPENGKTLIQTRGCLGCHSLQGETISSPIGPDLTYFAEKTLDHLPFPDNFKGQKTRISWILEKLSRPKFTSYYIMPNFSFSDSEKQDLLIALLSMSEPAPEVIHAEPLHLPPLQYPKGNAGKLMKELQCLTCHTLNGVGGNIAPELNIVGSRIQYDWLLRFMKEPSAIRPAQEERMPFLYMSDNEILEITNYLFYATKHNDVPDFVPNLDDIESGKILYQQFRCYGCHQIDQAGGSVGPNLTLVGDRLQPQWIYYQLLHPEEASKIEPKIITKEEDAKAIASFLASLKAKQ